MYKNLKAWSRAFFSVVFLGAVTLARAEPPPLQVGFVYVAPLTPSGWVAQHDAGRRAMESAINTPQATRRVVTRYVENVAEGADAERVIREMARDGVDLIITPSCLLYTSPSPRDYAASRMPSSA